MGFIRFDLDSVEEYVANHLRLFISMAVGILIFVGIIAVSVFFMSVRGAEQTMVPDVRGKDLTEAMLELQVKELYPRLQLRYSQSARDKGLILEQDPPAGTIVKAGRRIRLVVSQGVMISKVENYVGQNIDEVRMDLQTLISSSGGQPLLSLKEPLMYDYSAEPPGAVLNQKPEPGTDISGPMALEFVVSLGPEDALVTAPQLEGLSIADALEQIGGSGIKFSFSLQETGRGERPGTVIFQNPPPNTRVPVNTTVRLTATIPPELPEGEVFSLFRYTIPQNPYPLPVRLEALLPGGERLRLISVDYSGGEFTVPYRLPAGSTLVLSMLNREIYRETVSALQ
ncbi:MAG: PASTA domain-containing protein [Treponema sp.]|jgi:beta-lactam-binding protein with PASTA domain|nr:PASTA domain-containing protein [Treponema sp.]